MKTNRTPGDLTRRKMLELLGVAGAAALTGGSRLLLRLTRDGQGYAGSIAVGLRMS